MRLASYEVTIAAPIEMVHHGLPPEAVPDHQRGWSYFLGILRDQFPAR